MPDSSNAKEYYNSYLKKKKPNISYYRTSKSSHKFSKTRRRTEKISQGGSGKGSNSYLYGKTKKSKTFLNERNVKITGTYF